MKDIIIYGSGGMAREVVQLIEDINKEKPVWNILGYLDDYKVGAGETINGYKVLGGREKLCEMGSGANVVLAISDPKYKEKIYNSIKDLKLNFPVLIHPTAKVADSSSIGEGCIIGIDCIVSVNVSIGSHVFLNMRTVLGHDVIIGDYCTCLVNCVAAGNVTVGKGSVLGSGCIIMEKRTIGEWARVGMGSLVCFDVQDGHVVMSRPSKSMYFGKDKRD